MCFLKSTLNDLRFYLNFYLPLNKYDTVAIKPMMIESCKLTVGTEVIVH